MFMLSIRLSKKRVLIGLAAVVVVLVVGVTGIRTMVNKDVTTAATPVNESAETAPKPSKTKVKTNEQRLEFIGAFGWEVEEEPVEVIEVIIPEEFDEVYLEYNDIQKLQGYDLESYSGKRCKRYSYQITNYPGVDGDIRINLLVYKDKVIGGDVCSLDLNGFMHGFAAE